MLEESISLTNKGMKLVGRVAVPDEGPEACLVLFHGFGGWKDETKKLFVNASVRATEMGLACVRFDFRFSKTDTNGSESEGALTEMLPSEWISDAKAIVAYCRERFIGLKLGAVGLSMGGLVGCHVAAEGLVDAFVSWSAPTDFASGFSEDRAKDTVAKSLVGNFDSFMQDIMKYDPIRITPNITVPVLAVAGEKDEMVPPSQARLLFDSTGGTKSLYMIGGADHVFSNHQAEVIEVSLAWLKQTILARGLSTEPQ
jgi:dienelactone hydrolase